MKKKILSAKTAGVIAATLLVFTTLFSSGATFTAVASGNWSSSTTWGGSVPPFTIISDQVIIPSGINVTMDNNVSLSGVLASLDVGGTLSSASLTALTVTTGSVSGAGVINVGNITFESTALISFSGSLTANIITCAVPNLLMSADIMANQALHLASGVLNLQTGSTLDVGADATISIEGGMISLNGGSVGLSGSYNVSYIVGSAIAGVELTGIGLSDVSVNVGPGSTVTLSGDLNVSGTLYLTTGTLVLAGHNLTISGNVASSGTGDISSTAASNISIATTTSVSGVLLFTATGNAVNNFTVNVGGNGSVMIGSDIIVHGILNLASGHLNVGSYNIEIGASGSITGEANTSYIITAASGSVSMHLTAGASASTTFPVGTPVHFCPAEIQLNPGSSSGEIFVGAGANVYTQGTSGVDISMTQPLVDATWFIHSEITTNLNMNVTLLWPATAEVNTFNRTAAYISHNMLGTWDAVATASATLEANGMYSLSRNNITSLSPFAVFDQSTNPSSVAEITNDVTFNIYPNPAADFINITWSRASVEPVFVEIVNIIGARLYSNRITRDNTIVTLTKYVPGNYFVRVYNDSFSVVKKFTKM